MTRTIASKFIIYFQTMKLRLYQAGVNTILKALAFFWLKEDELIPAKVKTLNKTLAVQNHPSRKRRN